MSNQRDPEEDEPQGRPEEANRPPHSFLKELETLSRPDRDDYGRFKKGSSGNPGGIRKDILEARRAMTFWLPAAIKRNAALMLSTDPVAASLAISRVLDRAMGKASSPAELPTDDTTPEAGDASPRALLDRAMRLKARTLALAESQLESGQPLSDSQRQALNEDISALSSLLKAEADAAKNSDAAGLTDEDLKAKVLSAMSYDELKAEVARRVSQPTSEAK